MSIKESVAAASAYLTEHPDEARYRDSAARARLVDGLRTEVSGPGGERLETDMPAGIGGSAAVPSPGWYFRAAVASCVATLIGSIMMKVAPCPSPGLLARTVPPCISTSCLTIDSPIPSPPWRRELDASA